MSSFILNDLLNLFLIGYIENYKNDKFNINLEVLKVCSEVVFRKDLSRVIIFKNKRIIFLGFVIFNLIKNIFLNVNYIILNKVILFYGKGELEFEYDFLGYLDRIEKVLI